ncbi:VOC family protein [Streptomyces sp. Z26]|uniref:VOC family protein n=1 Tax=Streptomyces sp. Z26 TaxID=2500177 RepID=UPI000EF1755E|nr:VOC family protein [Streptomyces sp. Z26]RLL67579.1 VOC family protein [Streptomyces sp. Z26]
MTVLKTYARLWTDDLDRALPLLQELTGRTEPDLRLPFEDVELAAIGDFLVIAGTPEARAAYAHASATVVVRDLDRTEAVLRAAGATITTPLTAGPTGRFLYARHADGAEAEYVEWVPDLVRRLVPA